MKKSLLALVATLAFAASVMGSGNENIYQTKYSRMKTDVNSYYRTETSWLYERWGHNLYRYVGDIYDYRNVLIHHSVSFDPFTFHYNNYFVSNVFPSGVWFVDNCESYITIENNNLYPIYVIIHVGGTALDVSGNSIGVFNGDQDIEVAPLTSVTGRFVAGNYKDGSFTAEVYP